MGSNARRKLKPRQVHSEVTPAQKKQREKDANLEKDVEEVLKAEPVNLKQLRKLSAIRGLPDNKRAEVWPLLLGVKERKWADTTLALHASIRHKDSSTVDVDVQRSIWSYTEGWTKEAREARRTQLRDCLNGVVNKSGGDAHYYQGLHEVAAVLLFTCGAHAAPPLLERLMAVHLRDFTRPTMDAVLELLTLIMPLLQQVDREVHAHLAGADLPPHYALGWLITWFTHTVPALDQAARLFDLFLATHPLMPLYFACMVIQAERDAVLACEQDYAELHSLLTNLPVLGRCSVDELAKRAVAALRQYPPEELHNKHRLHFQRAVLAHADLKDDHWRVPEQPPAPPGRIPWTRLHFYTSGSAVLKQAAVFPAVAAFAVLAMAMYASYVQNVGGL